MIERVYILSPMEIWLANRVGNGRCQSVPVSIRFNDSGYHASNGDRAFPHIIGVKGEIAYSKLTNQEFEERIIGRGDETDFNGVEIKTSTYEWDNIELKVKQSEYPRKIQRAYVLARLRGEAEIEFIGAISRKRFHEIKYPKRHKFVDNWCVKGNDLTPCLPVVTEGGKIELLYWGREVTST